MDREGLTQAEAAKRLGVVQTRISEIARNKVDQLSLDDLVGLSAKVSVSVAVKLAACTSVTKSILKKRLSSSLSPLNDRP
jgi:transcriptional regulator with XRE-family HTH domain